MPYRQLVGAADARNLNAAVVDTSSYWVAAIDRDGHVIAAQIPRPKAGRDFAQPTTPGAVPGRRGTAARRLPGAFDLAARLRDDGVTVLSPAPGRVGLRLGPERRRCASCSCRSASPWWRCSSSAACC